MRIWDRLITLLEAHVARHPDALERLITSQERQAAALERLVELGETYLGVDPVTLAAAAEAAQPADHQKITVSDPDLAAYEQVEQITIELASSLGRIPSDEEVHAELDRREALEQEATRVAAGWQTEIRGVSHH